MSGSRSAMLVSLDVILLLVGATAKDGKFTRGERDEIRTFGGKELKKLKNEKGIKLSFGKEPEAGTGTYGLSIHRNPTIVLRESTAAEGGAVDTGKTIAHELGHVLTLGAGHKVEDTNDDGDFDDPNEKADSGGHSYDPNHIMHEDGKGTKFTKAQIEEMKRNKYKHGKCSVQWDRAYPAKKVKQQYGATTDARGDHLSITPTTTGMFDIDRVVLTSLAETDHLDGDFCNIDIQFTVAGALAPGECFAARYALGFDSDADQTTGVTFSTYEGIDRIVNLHASLGGLDDVIIPVEPVPFDIIPIPRTCRSIAWAN